MREEILDFLQSQNLGTFIVSREQPWSENGTPMYLKNLKKVYATQESTANEPLFLTLDALDIPSEVTTVTVYLACDSKQVPATLNDAVQVIKTAKNITTVTGVNRRQCDVSTSYENDVLVTEIAFQFTKLT